MMTPVPDSLWQLAFYRKGMIYFNHPTSAIRVSSLNRHRFRGFLLYIADLQLVASRLGSDENNAKAVLASHPPYYQHLPPRI